MPSKRRGPLATSTGPQATSLTTHDWAGLVASLKRKTCVPVLGAGVNYGLLPLGGEIARTLSARDKYPLDDASDLMRVAQYVAVMRDNAMAPKREVLEILSAALRAKEGSRQFAKALGESTQPLALLAQLPVPVYITTNYDDLLIRTLRLHRKDPHRDYCRWNTWLRHFRPADQLPEPTAERPLVYHLHGSDQEERSIVLTEDDYLDFLANLSKWPDMIPPRIQEALSGSLLFIGYRIADWSFRTLIRGINAEIEDSVRQVSVAIQLRPQDAGPHSEKTVEYLNKYYRKMNIRTYWGEAGKFSRDLWTRWRNA